MNWHNIILWEQKYIDLWTIPHLFTGIVLALICLAFIISLKKSFLSTIIITAGWELIEYAFQIDEFLSNRFIDVFISLIGFILTIWLIKFLKIKEKRTIILILIVLIILFLISNLIGWFAWMNYGF